MGSHPIWPISLLFLLSRKVSKSFFFIGSVTVKSPCLWFLYNEHTPKCVYVLAQNRYLNLILLLIISVKRKMTPIRSFCVLKGPHGVLVMRLYVCNLQYVSLIIMNSPSIRAHVACTKYRVYCTVAEKYGTVVKFFSNFFFWLFKCI